MVTAVTQWDELPQELMETLVRGEAGPRLGTLALEISLERVETKALSELFQQTFIE